MIHVTRPGVSSAPQTRRARGRGAVRLLDPERLADNMPQLRRIARRLCRCDEEADELLQETMLQVLKRPRYIKHDTDLPYLATVMRHAFYARKHLPAENASLDDLGSDMVPDTPAAVEDAVLARLLIREIDELPDAHRNVVLAVEVSGLSYGDAARMLAVPEGTIRSRLHRARRQLAKSFEPVPG